jgi:regulator of protease activity HflC (stomatin/prohibitin superfamily)
LFREFGDLTLLEARAEKSEIFQRIFIATRDHFAPLGVTITSLGGSEGMIYSDPNVQTSINANFEAQQEQVRAEAAATAQAVNNERLVSQANAQATATVIAGQAAAEVIRLQGEAEAEVLASQGSQIQQYPGLVNYELALQSQGQVPQFLIVGNDGADNLPFSFFLEPVASPTPGN